MSRLSVVVDKLEDWADFYSSRDVLTLTEYLNDESPVHSQRRVINLCRSYAYLGTGYYCSLLAEARGHRVVPSLRCLGDFSREQPALAVPKEIQKYLNELGTEKTFVTCFYFGRAKNKPFAKLAKQLYDSYSLPVLQVRFEKHQIWSIGEIQALGIHTLSGDQKTEFANALDSFSGLMWRKPKKSWQPKYELAILVDPQEKFPPSDAGALKKMILAAKQQSILAQLITPEDMHRLAEFDGLFIRATTAVNHYTYTFARRAEELGIVVIDDSQSILRCTNKIYLAKMFETLCLPAPKTILLAKDKTDTEQLVKELGFPLILKIPDGAFSVGVHKVESHQALSDCLVDLFDTSSFVIAQQYCYTEYDWRIGVLGGQAIYACRYYMVKGHWAIYQHSERTGGGNPVESGAFDAMPTHEVPQLVIKTALAATKAIGTGFYGVDLKQSGDQVLLIEVNDNPSIDEGVEDLYLGDRLYELILAEFRKRLEAAKL